MGIFSRLKSKLEEGTRHNHSEHDPATSSCDRYLSRDGTRGRERLEQDAYKHSREPVSPVRRWIQALPDIGEKEPVAEADGVQLEEAIPEPNREAAAQSQVSPRRTRHMREYATIYPASLDVRAATANNQIRAGPMSLVSSRGPALKNYSRNAPPSPVPLVSQTTPINPAGGSSSANASSSAKTGRRAKTRTNIQPSTPTTGTCIHKMRTGCILSYISRCCACADRRPRDSEYLVYIDGLGEVARGTRWQHYCPSCSGKSLLLFDPQLYQEEC